MSATTSASGAAPRAHRASLLTWIRLDAAVSGAAGLLLAAGAPVLDDLLGPSTAVLAALGLFLLAYAGSLGLLARAGAPDLPVAAVIAGNTLWAAASIVVVLADLLSLTATGKGFTLAQAAVVAVLAELQLSGLRRARQLERASSSISAV